MMVTAMRHSGISEQSEQTIRRQALNPAAAMRVKPVANLATASDPSLALLPVNALTLTKRNKQAGG